MRCSVAIIFSCQYDMLIPASRQDRELAFGEFNIKGAVPRTKVRLVAKPSSHTWKRIMAATLACMMPMLPHAEARNQSPKAKAEPWTQLDVIKDMGPVASDGQPYHLSLGSWPGVEEAVRRVRCSFNRIPSRVLHVERGPLPEPTLAKSRYPHGVRRCLPIDDEFHRQLFQGSTIRQLTFSPHIKNSASQGYLQ